MPWPEEPEYDEDRKLKAKAAMLSHRERPQVYSMKKHHDIIYFYPNGFHDIEHLIWDTYTKKNIPVAKAFPQMF